MRKATGAEPALALFADAPQKVQPPTPAHQLQVSRRMRLPTPLHLVPWPKQTGQMPVPAQAGHL